MHGICIIQRLITNAQIVSTHNSEEMLLFPLCFFSALLHSFCNDKYSHFCFPNIQTDSEAYLACQSIGTGGLFYRGQSGRGIELISHIHLLPRLRMCGAILPLPLCLHALHSYNYSHLSKYLHCFIAFNNHRVSTTSLKKQEHSYDYQQLQILLCL